MTTTSRLVAGISSELSLDGLSALASGDGSLACYLATKK